MKKMIVGMLVASLCGGVSLFAQRPGSGSGGYAVPRFCFDAKNEVNSIIDNYLPMYNNQPSGTLQEDRAAVENAYNLCVDSGYRHFEVVLSWGYELVRDN
jgi:hypothetical protein